MRTRQVYALTMMAVLVLACGSAGAQVLLTFGDNEGGTNSPGQVFGAFTGTWELLDADNLTTPISGLTVDIGGETGDGTGIIDYAGGNTAFSSLGNWINTDLYEGSTQSAAFENNDSEDQAIGVKISGLEAGIYHVFVTARNTNILPQYMGAQKNTDWDEYDVYMGLNANDFSQMSMKHMTNIEQSRWDEDPNDGANHWMYNDGVVAWQVEIAEGDFLAVASDGTVIENQDGEGNKAQLRGFLNTIEIVKRLPGDANSDWKVSAGDLGILAGNWGTDTGLARWDQGDFNLDGNVSAGDLGILAGNWQVDQSTPSAVPEPVTLAMLAVGGVAVLRTRR